MARNLISERSFTDRKQVVGSRAEMFGWGLLVFAGLLWMMRGSIVEHATTRWTAMVEIVLGSRGSATSVQQAFATARKSCTAEATLIADTNPAVHGRIFDVNVTADSAGQALADQAAMAKAMEVTQAALPEDEGQFKVDPVDGHRTHPAATEALRLELALRALAVLIATAAQIAIVLGTSVQISMKPSDLWGKLALTYLSAEDAEDVNVLERFGLGPASVGA